LFFHNTHLNEQGISNDEILLGESCALSGPAQKLGSEFSYGADAYFKYINSHGGVHNREIKLLSVDDMYEPTYATKNSKELITKKRVFALFGEIGTPTSKAALRVAREYKTPFLTPFTGAQFLREKENSLVVNFRSSYFQETEALVEYLTSEKKIDRISIFYQNDSYGKAGYEGVVQALKKRNIKLLSEGRYRRNTLSYMNALSTIEKSKPEAIILIGAYKPSAHFIKSAKRKGLKDTIFCNISFVGSEALVKALDYNMDNILISQVVPLPWDSSNASVKEYQEVYRKYFPFSEYSFVSLEGFLSAKLVVKAMQEAGRDINREKFMSAFKKLDNSVLEDLFISFDDNDNQASDSVYITKYENNKFIQISKK
jgi:ABC-type branched-subunit amino acid transport system substrate-binding protein